MHPMIARQIDAIRAEGVGASKEINPFWRNLLSEFGEVLANPGAPDLARLQRALGYGSARLPAGKTNRGLPTWPALQAVIDSGSRAGSKDAEHAAQLHFLARRGVLDDYLAWLDREGLISDMGVGRLYWYSRKLRRHLGKLALEGPHVCLEVGSGSGRFAHILASEGLVGHYMLVDLPEMLLNAMITLTQRFPEAEFHLDEAPDTARPGLAFWFFNTKRVKLVSENSVDVALNFNSLMEMDRGIRDFYLEYIYRTLRPGGLFYNVNRRQKQMTRLDGAVYENNPLFYPYPRDDRVIEWEPDECQESCRSQELISPNGTFAISRVAQKAAPPAAKA